MKKTVPEEKMMTLVTNFRVSSLKRYVARGMLFLPFILFLCHGSVCWGGRDYYSIHVQSFRDLANANAYVNAIKSKRKVVFWKKTQVPGKGEFYRVYLGKYQTRAEAMEVWKKLKEEGAVSYLGIHRFTGEDIVPGAAGPPEKTAVPAVSEEKMKPASVPGKPRFVDNGDGTVTDNRTRLMWTKNGWRLDFFSAVPWTEAIRRCRDFRLGGYTDWRLPTIDEWKTLLDSRRQCPALVEPNPFQNIIVHMPYWSESEFVYGKEYTCSTRACPVQAYTVLLYFGRINHQNKNKRAFILPVRSLD
ncbi:MAG: hypothetical protein DRH56_06175 [Deltaproteobacteria bacterium]|nr:MAG: hypothetical protein DRH56_06175 [Deltaproteobacteria bacterium]